MPSHAARAVSGPYQRLCALADRNRRHVEIFAEPGRLTLLRLTGIDGTVVCSCEIRTGVDHAASHLLKQLGGHR